MFIDMNKWLFFFISDIRLCLLYSLQHIGGNNPKPFELNPRDALKEFMVKCLDVHQSDNLVFITLHFSQIKRNMREVIRRTHKIYARLWLRLQGRYWRKRPMPSISIVERGKGGILHVHTILNMKDKTPDQLKNALLRAYEIYDIFCGVRYDITYDEEYQKCKNYIPVEDHLLIKPVFNLDGLEDYITKEFNWLLIKPTIDFENFWTSEMLFTITETNIKPIQGYHRRKRIV